MYSVSIRQYASADPQDFCPRWIKLGPYNTAAEAERVCQLLRRAIDGQPLTDAAVILGG